MSARVLKAHHKTATQNTSDKVVLCASAVCLFPRLSARLLQIAASSLYWNNVLQFK